MPCSPQALTIGDIAVQQDAHGRYSLNDLHRAAGGEARHAPGQFFRHAGIREFVEEIRCANPHIAPVESVRGGQHQGTYACRTLVLRYAAWISPAFELKVYKVFEDYVDGRLSQTGPALPATYLQALEALVAAEKEKLRLAEENAVQARLIEEQRPAQEFVKRFVSARGSKGVQQVAKRINRRQNDLVAELLRDKVMYRSGGDLAPSAEYEARGYFVVKNGEKNGKAFGHARFTPKGIEWAAKRYGREVPGESTAPALPAGPKQSSQLPLLPESTS